jgi:tyrosine-protein kinase Etk/Wzc
LRLDPAAFGDLTSISLALISKRKMLELLKENIEGKLDRSGIILSISYTHIDPAMSAQVTNSIADMYIKKLTEIKRFRTVAVLETFEEQLNVSRQELQKSEAVLRVFRERNPYLMLTNAGSEIVSSLATNQTNLETIRADLDRLNILLTQRGASDFTKKSLAYLEVLSFLEARLVAGSQVYTSEYQDLITRRSTLLADNYSPGHPLVQDIESRLINIQGEVDERVQQYYNELMAKKNNVENTINESQGRIRRLPRNELQLAELQRDRRVKENIYSSILIRYNEAKISDAAIIPDAFVIEEAEIPITEASLVAKLKMLIIGPILGLVLSIGLIILRDLLDGTIKESKQVEFKMQLPVLSSIPVILNVEEIPPELEGQAELDSKLITSDYGPHLAGEKFRLLRTKLTLNNESEKKTLIITSHSPGDGKSLVASNLAITFAQQKSPTVLLDCDLRRGVLHHSFSCNKKPGIADLLISSADIDEDAIKKITQQTHVPNLLLISSGQQVPNPSELLGSKRMQILLKALLKYYQNIIIDTPPFAVISDALVLDNFVHNMLLVVRYGQTNLNKLSQKIEEYKTIKSDFRGVVLNATEEVVDKDHYSYSYYHY